ncbi:MAG TPA: DUF2269 family protein [Anaerolineales bacterium]|nr:DUF2269 family protein [Anaerolineales bacterium]
MSWYLLLRFLHILSSIVFIGGIFARQAVRSRGKKATSIRELEAYFSAAGQIEKLMVIPGNMAVIVFGVILAIMMKAPIFGFLQGASQNWLLVTNLMLVAGGLMVPLVFLPRGKIFDRLMQDALGRDEITSELRSHLDDAVVKRAHFLEMFLVVVIVILMVFKPF